MLTIYNSLTKSKQPFTPITPGKIGIYVCGMTVYDYCHLGHARTMVCFDVIVRYLRAYGYQVNYVMNITDIDDKIIQRANQTKQDYQAVTEKFIQALHEDQQALGILLPDQEPRATTHIDHIIHLIQRLLDKGIAYIGANGDVYYDVSKFPDYGKLSHKDIEGQEAGARIDVVSDKRNPLDFVLWKPAKPNEPAWASPWGDGRPGWHIECSAMSMHCLGEQFDIHGGGFDLQFPHHENEIAQSEGATDKTFVNTWMHVGFLQINKEKMSKSLGNFFTIRDVLNTYDAETVRYFLLSSQYRSQLNYSTDNLDNARKSLERLYMTLRDVAPTTAEKNHHYREQFTQAMDDDFNTPEALAVLFEISHQVFKLKDSDAEQAASLSALMSELAAILGLLQQTPASFLQGQQSSDDSEKIEQLIKDRETARANKDWALADNIRDQLTEMGIALEDSANGTIWRKES